MRSVKHIHTITAKMLTAGNGRQYMRLECMTCRRFFKKDPKPKRKKLSVADAHVHFPVLKRICTPVGWRAIWRCWWCGKRIEPDAAKEILAKRKSVSKLGGENNSPN